MTANPVATGLEYTLDMGLYYSAPGSAHLATSRHPTATAMAPAPSCHARIGELLWLGSRRI
jgi:hypothetical protein